ncbi:MAG: MFS transporter [Legionellales bacterium RIFCSPHIGHO2_12_FULL_42_9]|nr:MAG: MFS transporter [Legionellales bacterium RIFCSPHIGHO2_12_FULL_42_9]
MSTKNNTAHIAWKNLPSGIVPLFFIQIFSTLSFSVLYSTLVLYITAELGLPANVANSITGVFVAFNFALHLLGGYWGGRIFSYRALFCLGMIAQAMGCLLLATQQVDYLYLGLGAFLTGSGLNVTCINCMLTQRFSHEDPRRETAFLYNYAGMNLGFFIGYSLSGYFQMLQNYQGLFVSGSVGNLIALLICLYFSPVLADKETNHTRLEIRLRRQYFFMGVLLIAMLPFVLSKFLHFADFSNKMVLVTGGIMLMVACWLGIKQKSWQARMKLQAFTVLMVMGTLFWMLFQTAPMGLTHFIDHNVQRHWLFVTIPPQWFQNINTICIVIGGPAMSFILNRLRKRGFDVNVPAQFSLALLCIGVAFVLLPVGIAQADPMGLVAPSWILFSFVLQSVGELLISPIGYAMVGALVPRSLQGVMMGMWMLASGVGATLASYCSNWMTDGVEGIDPLVTNPGYGYVFLRLGLLAITTGFVLMLLVPLLKRWIREDKAPETVTDQFDGQLIAGVE